MLCSPRYLRSQDGPAARLLNLTSDSKSLPLWTKPEPRAALDLEGQSKVLYPGVFIIGHPKGGFGTGFVVSQEHRLIATNAHVADILYNARSLMAIGNDSTQVFKVEKAWYHPGVIRDVVGTKARSQDPSDGDVYSQCPDVAVVRVGGSEELPPALPLATPGELESLFAQPVGMLGFPGHDTLGWPGLGEEPQATYRQGVIARATDFENDANADTADLQFLQHTMANWYGFSGSPIFLTNGHVAAINNSARTAEEGGLATTLAFGIRIDCLWELVAHHGLQDKLSLPVPVAELRLARFEGEDLELEKLARVWELLDRGAILQGQQKWAEAGRLMNEAIEIAPNCARSYTFKSLLHNEYAGAYGNLSAEVESKQYELAVKYAKKALLLQPNDVDCLLKAATNIAILKRRQGAREFGESKDVPEVATIARNVLAAESLTPRQKALAYFTLSTSYASNRKILEYVRKAIGIWPYEPSLFSSRARCYEYLGDRRKAAADRAKADTLAQAYQLYHKCRLEDDPAERVRLAEEACELTDYGYFSDVEQLARAHHANGNHAEAVRWGEKAWKLVESWPDCEAKSSIARDLEYFRLVAGEK